MTATVDVVDDQRRAVAAAIELLRDDLARPVRLRDLADAAAYSPYHLNRIFRSAMGVPPGEFRAAVRFHAAKHLLLETNMSVTAICSEVGFDSLGTFSSRFHDMIGVTPRELRALPERLRDDEADRVTVLGSGGTAATVSGTVEAPGCGPVYVGAFTSPMPRSVPVAGSYLPEPGFYSFGPVPLGTYHVLAAAFPPGTDVATQLLGGGGVHAARAAMPIEIRTGVERLERDIRLLPGDEAGFPILVALPALR